MTDQNSINADDQNSINADELARRRRDFMLAMGSHETHLSGIAMIDACLHHDPDAFISLLPDTRGEAAGVLSVTAEVAAGFIRSSRDPEAMMHALRAKYLSAGEASR